MGNYCTDEYRRTRHPGSVVIQAEPTNPVDSNAVTVASRQGKRLGYMSAGNAKAYHGVVASLGAIEVPCTEDGLKWWMEIPTLPSLRKVAQGRKA
ncbi:HIRAN domain-containing protein [Brevibacterium zhoupengii]|uniref:HIRAN domain-containing protein n=1 Tax=Brevibacterium zhoupengii TaxID=2898795 RepID=UPI00374C8EDA